MADAVARLEQTTNWREVSVVRKIHGVNAKLLGIFIAAHIVNHLTLTVGVENHLATMDMFRAVYRLPAIEYALYGLFVVQIFAGLYLAKRNWKPSSGWAWAQVSSGLLIAFFLVQHLTATIYVRNWVPSIDTDAFWAVSVVSELPIGLYFVPYYFTAVAAIFIHIGAALHFKGSALSTSLAKPVCVIGMIIATVIVSAMTGWFGGIELPENYRNFLESMGA